MGEYFGFKKLREGISTHQTFGGNELFGLKQNVNGFKLMALHLTLPVLALLKPKDAVSSIVSLGPPPLCKVIVLRPLRTWRQWNWYLPVVSHLRRREVRNLVRKLSPSIATSYVRSSRLLDSSTSFDALLFANLGKISS